MTIAATPLRTLDRRIALLVLAFAALALIALLASSFAVVPPTGAADGQTGDLALYGRIVAHLRAGEAYYPAAHAELLAQHYPTISVFNWRTPLLLWLVSLAPTLLWAQIVFGLVTIATGGLVLLVLARQGSLVMAAAAVPVLLLSLGSVAAPGTVYFGEIVAGILILASACCYGLGRWLPGLAIALLALFVRELAAPYVLVCLVCAWRDGRRRELVLAAIGLVAFAVYYGLHALVVKAQLGPQDIGDPHGWIQFGGLGFVLGTAAFNGVFLLLPLWVSAVVLPLALLGLFAFPAGRRMGVTVAVYVVFFAIAGKAFNDYWGALYTPLLAAGLVWSPFALRDLIAAARTPRTKPSHGAHGL